MKKRNRGLILTAAAFVAAITGGQYIWSIFKIPLMELNGWSSNAVTLTYSLFLLFVLVGTACYGPLSKRLKPKYLTLMAGTFQGMGFFLTGFSHSIVQLYLFYSFLGGLGNGMMYNAAVSTATKWFPDKKVMANGICIGCLGLSPVFFSPGGTALIGKLGILPALRILGLIMVGVIWIVSWFIEAPEEGYKPEGWEPKAGSINAGPSVDYSPSQVIKMPLFWCAFVMTIMECSAGLMMTSQASAIAQQMIHITAEQASLQVAVLAVGNFIGRFLFGTVSDKLGRLNTQLILMAMTAVDMLFFFGKASNFVSFMIVLLIVGIGFGGIMTTLPALTSDLFGQKYFTNNYALLFAGYTAASFVGPMIASNIFQSTGSYNRAFWIAGVIAAVGIVLILLTKAVYKKQIAK